MIKIFNRIAKFYFTKSALPYWMVLLLDCFIVVASGIFVHILKNGLLHTLNTLPSITFTWCCYLLFFIIGFRITHSYSGVIRYSSFVDLVRIAFANFIGVSLIFLARHLTSIDIYLAGISWSELVGAFIITTALMWMVRIMVKYVCDVFFVADTTQRVFIYGVKGGGLALAKALRTQQSQYIVSGFVSDDPNDTKHLLMGTKVYYNDEDLVKKMRLKKTRILMVSPLKTDDLRDNQQMIDMLSEAKVKILLFAPHEWDGKSNIRDSQLKEVDIEDLLPRNQIEVDLDAIGNVLTGKRILITGAAGSIGSEIVKQVASFNPAQLILIDQAETPLHDVRLGMDKKYPHVPCETITASITHPKHMETIFKRYLPEYIFHAAAYKHVPMMEDNPGEAVINNINGTKIMADLAVKYGAKKFVMISTDKAVNPTNVMGCSKRICEMYCQSLDKAIKEATIKGTTQFVTTRFGNVLGSNGSVIPIFKKQIRSGGPITVTHPEIIRYFMLIPEACKLVLQAGTMGSGGEIYVFDMGKPVKIADLAKRMIALSGASDIEIKYTGLRDGEKLYEELLSNEENTKHSEHPKIKLATVREFGYKEVCCDIDNLIEITRDGYNDMEIVKHMKNLVPEFKSKHSKYEALDN